MSINISCVRKKIYDCKLDISIICDVITNLFISIKSIMSTILTDEEIEVLDLYGKHIGMDLLTELTYEEQQIFIEQLIDTYKSDFKEFDEFEKYKNMDV